MSRTGIIQHVSMYKDGISDCAGASYASLEGDSGGAVAIGGRAAGVHIGRGQVSGIDYGWFCKHTNIVNVIG